MTVATMRRSEVMSMTISGMRWTLNFKLGYLLTFSPPEIPYVSSSYGATLKDMQLGSYIPMVLVHTVRNHFRVNLLRSALHMFKLCWPLFLIMSMLENEQVHRISILGPIEERAKSYYVPIDLCNHGFAFPRRMST